MTAIDVCFATNRDLLGSSGGSARFGGRFNADGPHVFRVGCAEMIPDGEGCYRPGVVRLAPERLDGDVPTPLFGSEQVFARLKARMQAEQADLLVLLHGFATDFEVSLARAAELAQRWSSGGRPMPVFVFSWPSDGVAVPRGRYGMDRADAASSGLAMARALAALLDFLAKVRSGRNDCGQRVHLVAHSMGNWALRHAVQGLRTILDCERLPRIFANVFLMAADEDDDALNVEYKLAPLDRLASAIHVYYANCDRALVVSDLTKGNPDRLGSAGPRDRGRLGDRIVCVDCSEVAWTGLCDGNHQYWRSREEVVRDARAVIAGMAADSIAGRRWSPSDRSYRILPETLAQAGR
ncbi:MAG TPA: alpha/beta fold hydrolase [Geminicoccus sp.]|jgi:esterase/lipase superfamily enzyme|uniref:alpha/beta fold hydrolase n=1 Tax=Geminicoccus sp. TaxID=2024832 RepID=UPI002E353803|nr:alpha/beta fold hydrolase [Geminicoccus sp.]HEX2525391.1 alpha/beta fold hydrolase [Geminicoccus sp.]